MWTPYLLPSQCRCNQMKQELVAAKCAVQRAQCQQMEIDVLRNELRKRDTALNAYDCQFQQIMVIIVAELLGYSI